MKLKRLKYIYVYIYKNTYISWKFENILHIPCLKTPDISEKDESGQ